MVYRLIGAMFFASLILALFLSMYGVSYVGLDENVYLFFKVVALKTENTNFAIPLIPSLNLLDNSYQWYEIVRLLQDFFNFITSFINGVIAIINVLLKVVSFIYFILETAVNYAFSVSTGNFPVGVVI